MQSRFRKLERDYVYYQLFVRVDRVARQRVDFFERSAKLRQGCLNLSLDIASAVVLFQWIPLLRYQLHTLYPVSVVTATSKTNRFAIP